MPRILFGSLIKEKTRLKEIKEKNIAVNAHTIRVPGVNLRDAKLVNSHNLTTDRMLSEGIYFCFYGRESFALLPVLCSLQSCILTSRKVQEQRGRVNH